MIVPPIERIGTCVDGRCWWCERTVGDGPGECSEPEDQDCDRASSSVTMVPEIHAEDSDA